MNIDDLKEMIDLVKDFSDLDENNLSCLETYNLVMRAREAMRRYNQSTKIQGDVEGHSISKTKNIHPSLFYSEDEWSGILKEGQERFFKKWGTA